MIKIIYFEGFMGVFGRWLYRGLISKIEAKFPGISIESRSWLFSKEVINDKNAIVIGHSFGAIRALKSTKNCKLLMTIDPRKGFNKKGVVYPLRNDASVFRHVNYYQDSKGLEGFKAGDEHSFNIYLHDESHGRIPTNKHIMEQVENTIRKG